MPTYTVGDGKEYSTIQSAIDAIPEGLAGGGVQRVEVYEKAATSNTYTEGVNASTGFVGADHLNYIQIIAMVPHNGLSHDAGGNGILINGRYNVTSSYWSCIRVCPYTKLTGFEIGKTSAFGNFYAVDIEAFGELSKCIIHDLTEGGGYGIYTVLLRGNCRCFDNFIYNIYCEGDQAVGIDSVGNADNQVMNNTVYAVTSMNDYAAGIMSPLYSTRVTNNYVGGVAGGTLSLCYRYDGGAISTYNMSEDSSANNIAGSGNQINKLSRNQFISSRPEVYDDTNSRTGYTNIGQNGQTLRKDLFLNEPPEVLKVFMMKSFAGQTITVSINGTPRYTISNTSVPDEWGWYSISVDSSHFNIDDTNTIEFDAAYSTFANSRIGIDANVNFGRSFTNGLPIIGEFMVRIESPSTNIRLGLQETSDCVDAGINLDEGFYDDIIGTTRPQGASWDIGAFEYKEIIPIEGFDIVQEGGNLNVGENPILNVSPNIIV